MDTVSGTTVPHILLLEDDRAHQDLVFRAFQNDPEKFRLSIAGNVQKAREIIGRDPPVLIISDWILPDGKGIDILPRRNGIVLIPLVIMTSYGDEHLAVEIMKSGAIDYVVKSATHFKELPHIARRALKDWENIQERKRAEYAVRDSEKRLGDIIDFLPDAMFAIDTEGRVIAWNNAIERMTGAAAKEMLGKGDYEYSIPFYGERRPILIDQVLFKVTEIEKKYDYLRSDGERITTETFVPMIYGGKGGYLWGTATPLYDSLGTRIGAIEVIRDITERKRTELELVSAQQQLKEAHHLAHIGTWDWVTENDTVTWSEELYHLVGMDPSQPAPTYAMLQNLYTPSSWERLSSSVTRALATGEPYNLELELIHTEGSIRWMNAFGDVKHDAEGKVIGLYGTMQDITDKKTAELVLQQREAVLETLLNAPRDTITLLDRQGTIIRTNDEGARRLGGTVEEVTGRCVYDLLPPDVAEERKVHSDAVFGRGEPALFDDTRSGRDLHNEIFPIFNPEHTAVDHIAIFARDITDQKQAELALKESEHRSAMLLKAIPDMMFVISREGVYRDFSVSDPGMLARSADQIIGTNIRDSGFLKESTDAILYHIEEALRTKALQQFEYELEIAGNPRQYEARIVALSEDEVLGIVRDITDRKKADEKLRESEERYASLFNRSLDCIYIHDFEGNFLDANTSALELLGYSREEIPHLSFLHLLSPDQSDTAKNAVETIVREGSHSGLIEYRLQRKDGRFVDIETKATLIIHDGKPHSIFGIARDITQRKAAEAAINTTLRQLERSEALLRNVYDLLPIGLWLADKTGTLYYGNPAGVKIWGAEPHVPPEKYGVFKARRYPSGEEIALDDWALAHTIIDGVTIKDEMLEIDAFDGKKKIILNYTAPLYDAAGTIDGAIVVNQEVTDKIHAELALLENQSRLANAMDIAGLVNWEYDVVTGMFTFNDRFYALYETTAEREGGNLMAAETYLQDFVYPDDRPAVLTSIQKLLTITDPAYTGQVEYRITPRDGSVRTIIARFSLIMGPDGNVIRTLGANQDITDRKLMESEIRSLNTVLEQRVRDRTEALSKANDALEEENAQRLLAEEKLKKAYDEKVLLLKEIHHRVKNNLQIVASLLNLQSRYITDESTLAAIRESQNRVKAMALVHEKLYRADDIAHISLQEYIRFLGTGLFQFYGARIRGITFTLEIHEVNVDIDAAIPIGLILNELISNSLKYAFPEGRTGEVFISVKKEEHTLSILFRDNGVGIPADLDWKDTQSLGLRLVTTLVDQMNGTVELDRSNGTQFTLVLHEKEPRGRS